MGWLIWVGVVVVVLIAVFLIVVAGRSGTFRIERSVVIGAPAEVAFGLVNDFQQWRGWSPWERLDAGMRREYAGAASGVGAVYHWVGNKQGGEGGMTIERSEVGRVVGIRLDFLKPFAATNMATFTFQ